MKKLARYLIIFCLALIASRARAATFTVTNTTDSGAGSLRQAILQANGTPGFDVINFAAALSGQIVTLTSGEFPVTDDVLITSGFNALPTTVRRDSNASDFRIFNITDGNDAVNRQVVLDRLIITNGKLADYGGGISNAEDLTLSGCLISGNQAVVGGGISTAAGRLTLVNTTVSGNVAINIGGGFHMHATNVALTDSTIEGNTSGGNGAGIFMNDGQLTVTTTTISGNNALDSFQGSGGALIIFGGTASFTNSTLSNNTAGTHGGAIEFVEGFGGHVSLSHCTVFNNLATAGGGGISLGYDIGDSGLRLTLTNSIVAQNSNGDVRYLNSVIETQGKNLVQDGSVTGPNILNLDPQLGSLGNNGGTTRTNLPAAGSPAINAADNSIAAEFDQRGVPRPLPFGGSADLGAVEVGPVRFVDNIADENDGNYTPGDLSLREALSIANDGEAIAFSSLLLGRTISLTLGELAITKSDTIAAPDRGITIDAQGNSRVFSINDGNNSVTKNVEMRGLTIRGGSITGGDGGGIFLNESLRLIACTLRNNSANRGGGLFNGLAVGFNSLSVIRSTLNANSASHGGGIYNTGLMATINSTLSGNTASGDGGALRGGSQIIQSTITGNSANRGGGIFRPSANTVSLANSIVANSVSGGDLFNEASGGITLLGINLVEDGSLTGAGVINADPQLGPLQNNGGPTLTHAFLPGSPAIDAGDNQRARDLSANPLTTDQRGVGFLRIADATVDLGAFEAQGVTTTAGNDAYTVGENNARHVPAPGILTNDTNALSALLVSGPAHAASFTLRADGSFSYTPVANYVGGDSFTYRSVNGEMQSNLATVILTVRLPLIVTKIADTNDGVCDADCSLREAVAAALPADVIMFSSLFDTPQTIILSGSQLLINSKDLLISGKGAELTTIHGNNASRVFAIVDSRDVTISGLTITGGNAGAGGGIYNSGVLTLSRCVVTNNVVTGLGSFFVGGGIANYNVLHIHDSTISGNNSYYGGGIYNAYLLTMSNTTVSGNVAPQHAGGVLNEASGSGLATFSLVNCTITGNRALDYDGTATENVGGVEIRGADNQLRNTIIAGNIGATSGRAYPLDIGRSFSTQNRFSIATYNLIGDAASSAGITDGVDHNIVGNNGAGTIDVNTILDTTLADNGGSSPTHALVPNSAALDNGSAAMDPETNLPITNDQRGQVRPFDFPSLANASGGNGSDIGAVEIGAPQLVRAVSRKTHSGAGDFDIDLPLTGAPGVECRRGDGSFMLVFTFSNNLFSGNAVVTSGTGSVNGVPAISGNTMTVNLLGVADAQQITVTVQNISDAYGQTLASAAVKMGVLLGDVTGDRTVNSADVSQTKAQSGRSVSQANYREDVTVDGALNSADVSLVKSASGRGLPPSTPGAKGRRHRL